MARKSRIHYEGALYHVICRGNNREWIFADVNEKLKYLELLQNYKKKHDFKCYAYCVMGNHVHMLIEVKQVPLSKIMQGIQLVYTQYYNKKHSRIGHVFCGRYKAILCNKDAYLLMLIRYIHQNPLRAGIEDGMDYAWSSHKKYIGKEASGFVSVDFPLKMFDESSKSNAIRNYLNFVYEEDMEINSIKAEEFSEGTQDGHSLIEETRLNLSMNELVKVVAENCNITSEDLVSKKRYREIARAKKTFAWLCFRYTHYQQMEMAHVLGVSQASISKILRVEDEEILKATREIYEKVVE